MDVVINVDNSNKGDDLKYKDLFNVYVRVYPDDRYHEKLDEEKAELEMKVRSMNKRPRSMRAWARDMEYFREWWNYIIDKNTEGVPEEFKVSIFKLKMKQGLIKDYIPSAPRLKSKFHRECAKRGIIVYDEPTPVETFKNAQKAIEEEGYYERDMATPELSKKEKKKKLKKAKKDIAEIYKKKYKSGKLRGKHFNPLRSDVDFTQEYFMMKNKGKKLKGKKGKKGKKKKNYSFSYKDRYEKNFASRTLHALAREDYMDTVFGKTTSDDDMVDYNGVILSTTDVADLEIYQKLHSLGQFSAASYSNVC